MNTFDEQTAAALPVPIEPAMRDLNEAAFHYGRILRKSDDIVRYGTGVVSAQEAIREAGDEPPVRRNLFLFDRQDRMIVVGWPDVPATGTRDLAEIVADAFARCLLEGVCWTAEVVASSVIASFSRPFRLRKRNLQLTGPLPAPSLFRAPLNDAEQYRERLDDLREAARDEGYDINENSVTDFGNFLKATPFLMRRPLLALVDDGDIRASWRVGDRRLAVQFLGDGRVEYVLLDKQPVVDRGSIEGFWRLRDLESVLKAT